MVFEQSTNGETTPPTSSTSNISHKVGEKYTYMGEEQEEIIPTVLINSVLCCNIHNKKRNNREDLIHILATQIHMMVVSIKILANLFMIYLKNKEDLKTRP